MTENDDSKYDRHPGYGTIQISRWTGGGYSLFGSNLLHDGGVSVRINRAEKKRNLCNDWIHPIEELIEIQMSEAQFAHFVSSMNIGNGTPCTIQHVMGKSCGRVPDPSLRGTFEAELKEHVARIGSGLDGLLQEVQTVVGKKTVNKGDVKVILGKLTSLVQEIHSNLPFVQEQFEEAMEKTIEDSRIEIDAYVTNTLKMSGLQAMTDGNQQKKLALPE
jgi:hypothetical protein